MLIALGVAFLGLIVLWFGFLGTDAGGETGFSVAVSWIQFVLASCAFCGSWVAVIYTVRYALGWESLRSVGIALAVTLGLGAVWAGFVLVANSCQVQGPC